MRVNRSEKRRPARPKLSAFAIKLLAEWRRLELPVADATVVVAVSGGADSSALFLSLDELFAKDKLRLKLVVAHLDHGLRQASGKDARWVSALAKQLGYNMATSRRKITSSTTSGGSNLEQAARRTRYKFLQTTAIRNNSNFVLTAHTLDDQAETILMRLLRGSAAEGLSGTLPVREIERGSKVKLVRPLLSWARRADTESYCRLRQIDFRVDEMNYDETFSRVRVRQQLLPLMKSFNNRIVEALSRTATLLNEDAAALSDDAKRLLELAGQSSGKTSGKNLETSLPRLSVDILLQAPAAVRRRALREWILRSRGDLRRLEMVHLLAVERLLKGGRGGRVAELPDGMEVTRIRGMLELSSKKGVEKGPAGH
ncbi:MAG: tRNA lysidine(34) synthetase TilS [Acidobacteriota bacterium]|nr:tRNA lysidine(34) synthetase TilS [Acidobacteriota bacterium]